MAMSVDGLVTGMSTTDTVNQLMKLEALPQQALKTKVGVHNKVVAAYQSINSRLSSVVTATKAVNSADTWGSMKTTTSSDAAAVTAKPGAAAGSLSFRIVSLAAAHTSTYSADPTKWVGNVDTAPVISGSTFDITLPGGGTKTLTPADASLKSVVAAINAETDAPYRATAVQIEPGKYTLQLTAKGTGAAGVFVPPSIDQLGAAEETTKGTDAKLSVGLDKPYTISSATNTFADVLPGVTVIATREQAVTEPRITIGLTADVDGIAAKVQAMIDNANVALNEIASQSKTKTGEVGAGPLVGDSALRKLSQDILGAVSGGAEGLGSFSAVGVGLDRSGKLTFDRQKFLDAYKADPVKTQSYFDGYTENAVHVNAKAGTFEPGWDQAKGLSRKLETLALVASEGVVLPTDSADQAKQGLLQSLIQRRTSSVRDLNDQVSAWDVRLERRKAGLQRQFTGLEVAMGKMQQQSSWLAGQLANLPSY